MGGVEELRIKPSQLSTKVKLKLKLSLAIPASATPAKSKMAARGPQNAVCLPTKVVFHRRLSSTKGRLPNIGHLPKKSFSTYPNTLVDLIFVRTVNIPNLRSGLHYFDIHSYETDETDKCR